MAAFRYPGVLNGFRAAIGRTKTPPAEQPAAPVPVHSALPVKDVQPAVSLSSVLSDPLTHLSWNGMRLTALAGHFDQDTPGVSDQFLRDATVYDERYLDIGGAGQKIKMALHRSGRDDMTPAVVLDLGSGSGSSVFAAAELFPAAHIIASDLSPAMVGIMEQRAIQRGMGHRLDLVVADASRIHPVPGSVDLIIGSSMLHHLIDPFAALDQLLTGLRPGGLAVFYEPFQAGNVILRQCLGEIIRRYPAEGGLAPAAAECLQTCVLGLDLMLDERRDHPVIPQLDDKWSFTRQQFRAFARQTGRPDPLITSTNPPVGTWQDKTVNLLRSASGIEGPLPDWVNEVLQSADRHVSASLREELLMEGEIIFTA